jgi:hypothetical protein
VFSQATGAASEFTENLADNGGWAYQCTLRLSPEVSPEAEQMVFPNQDAGFVVGESGTSCAPGFARKKDAKQWAAKCCIQWLVANGHMTSEGRILTFPPRTKAKPAAQPKKQQQQPASAIAGNHTNGNTTTITITPQKRPHPSSSEDTTNPAATTTTPEEEEDIPATQRVPQLCQQLGIIAPQYRITPAITTATTTSECHFDGYPDFGADSVKVPDGLGRVANVYGKKNTRERIAEEVLAWLVAEEQRRGAELAGLLALTRGQQAQNGNGNGEEGVPLK